MSSKSSYWIILNLIHDYPYIHKNLNPLPPVNDQVRISPYKNQYNVKQMSGENKEKYQLKITSWSNTKFSKLTLSELYGRQ